MAHFWEDATEYTAKVSQSFTGLKPANYTTTEGQTPRHYRETIEDISRIEQMLFGGFILTLWVRLRIAPL